MPCASQMRRSSAQEVGRRRNESALAKHRFDDDGGDAVGRDDAVEHLVEAFERFARPNAVMLVGKRRVIDLAAERPEVLLVGHVFAGHRERQQRAAMVAVGKCDHRRAARVLARNLYRILGRLGAGREQQRLFGRAPRRAGVERLGDGDVRLVGRDLETRVSQRRRLLGDGGHDLRMRVPGVEGADSAA